jgi:hypothetical protein
MTIFEDDAINDDFEVEITDLDPENETHPISSAIAALRSRISFKARIDDEGDASPDDDFEVEITDLPSTNDADDAVTSEGAGKDLDGEEALLLDHEKRRREVNYRHLNFNPASLYSRLPRKMRLLRQAMVGIAILLMLGVVLESIPSSRDALLGLFPRPTPTPTPATVSREFGRFRSFYSGTIVIVGDIWISSTPIAGVPVTPWNPNTPVANVLNAAPETCPSATVPQDPDSIDYPYDNRIGGPPLWVLGFHGYPANLTGFIRATPPQYGWVHPVTVMLVGGADDPVMLQGARLDDGTPLLFKDPYSEQSPTTFVTVNPGFSSVSDPDGAMIGGIAPISLYIPSAGCYYLKASWSGGSWESIFAAGE